MLVGYAHEWAFALSPNFRNLLSIKLDTIPEQIISPSIETHGDRLLGIEAIGQATY